MHGIWITAFFIVNAESSIKQDECPCAP